MTFKESFNLLFYPSLVLVVVAALFNISSLSFEYLIRTSIAVIGISLVGGGFIWSISKLFNKYYKKVFERIRRTFNGDYYHNDLIQFNFKRIVVYCSKEIKTVYLRHGYTYITSYSFHIPRAYIQKHSRKEFEFITPSTVERMECFKVFNMRYVTKKNLRKLNNRLTLIESKYIKHNH